MRRALWLTTLGLLPTVFPLACGSLNEGQVVIVDENAGAQNGGTTSGSAGKGGGGTAGGSSGIGGSTSGKGGSVNEAGEAGMGTGATGGTSSGTGGKGGSSNGGSNNGGDPGTGGTAGISPTDCTASLECSGSKPICDGGSCRACDPMPVSAMSDECRAELPNTPHCDGSTGQCVECLESADCIGSKSVCDQGVCRGCQLGSECDSGACNNGRCADETSIVYVSDTGSYDAMNCGTRDAPCRDPGNAATLLSGSRPFMVILYTSGTFNTQINLPPMIDGLAIFGNGVTLANYAGPVITMAGGGVLLDHVVVEADDSTTTPSQFAAVDCQNSNLKILGGSFTNLSTGYSSAALHLTNCNADVHLAEILNSTHGLVSVPASGGMAIQGLVLERSRLQGNREALEIDGDHFLIRNNLFISNGQTSYVRIIRLNSQVTSAFVFNTLYGNDNNCSYEGGLVVCTGAVENCGIQSSNLFWNNMYNGSGGTACPDQVYGYPPPIQYTLAETTWPGTGNNAADPLLDNVANDDYTPGAGSPAIGKAEDGADFVPPKDYYGNPRPVGAPDIGAVEVQ